MRLHSLGITAFGPFADTVEVDFDELGADGLFLLHGQTGAGKTSILDAVAFALFGTVPGARAQGKRLLSDHARPGAVPKVRLEATIAGRRLRLERSPEYMRPKLRGTGDIKQNAKATLEWLDGRGENLSRLPDIGEAVAALLGMSAEQFFQVALLPQGEFAKFLRAESDERGRLLERLFDTTRFGDVEKWFKERSGTGAKELAEHQKAVDVLAAKVAAAAGIEAGADAEPVEWAYKLLADAAEVRDTAGAVLDAARLRENTARERYDAAIALARRLERRAEALASLAEIRRGESDRAELVRERDAARKAEVVAVHHRESVAATATADAAQNSLDRAESSLVAESGGHELFDLLTGPPEESDRAMLQPRCDELTGRIAALDELLDDERRLRDTEARSIALADRRRGLEERRRTAADERAALPARIDEVSESVTVADKAAAELPGLESIRARANDAHAAGVELRARHVELERAEQNARDLHGVHNAAHETLLDIRARRIAGMAAELAARLSVGDPCEVCGSPTHPEPAQPAPDAATEDDEQRAHRAERSAAEALAAARTTAADIGSTVALLQQRAGTGSLDELIAARDAAVAAYDDAAAIAATRERLRSAAEDLHRRDTDLQRQLTDLDAELARLDRDAAVESSTAEEIRRRIEAAIGDGGTSDSARSSLEAARRRATRLLDTVTTWLDARVGYAQARATADRRTDEAQRAALDAGFTDPDAARAAQRPAARLDEIDGIVRAVEARAAVAAAVLAEPEIAALTGDETVDVEEARKVLTAADAEVDTALAAATDADRRHTDIATYTVRLEKAYAELVPLRDEQAEFAELAAVVAGGGANARKMSLRSYVLAARLEEVAEAASERLRRMSSGRYEFVHTDAAGNHGRRGGLGLDIRDEYTGAVRSTKTLSGGESFQASLALALGLADVVAAEAGGVVLDTMFIDEGFGTLDADALDAVMGVLDDLRSGGRVVGVVSHVDEMRQRIPSKLHVVRGRSGSSVSIVG